MVGLLSLCSEMKVLTKKVYLSDPHSTIYSA